MTLVCVPILADEPAQAKRDAVLAAEHGADIVEYRVDVLMDTEESLASRIAIIKNLVADSPLPCILTCRPEWEGGLYTGDEDERVSMFEALGTSDSPPAYIDVELKAYTASANIRQKINLAVDHPKQTRSVRTRLILSTHDFDGRPADLTRRVLTMQDEPACAVVKVAYRARSIRDNLELFDLLSERQKPTIALGMNEFGLMSRVLAPKFGGFLTFASLRDESATAPGQPTIEELLGMYRFRSIKPTTKVYGVIGWPVTQSMSPLVHNSGFEAIGWDGVYVPMPVEQSYESFKATLVSFHEHSEIQFCGASVTLPHKSNAARFATDRGWFGSVSPWPPDAVNTIRISQDEASAQNTDADAIKLLVLESQNAVHWPLSTVIVSGTGGVARAALAGAWPEDTYLVGRDVKKARSLAEQYRSSMPPTSRKHPDWLRVADTLDGVEGDRRIYINCTPVGMTGGPDPDGLSIPIPDMPQLPPETVFFDTVYNPIETPMLREAKVRGYRTIDGVQMFVKQAEAQFRLWTERDPPEGLFDRLVREKLSAGA